MKMIELTLANGNKINILKNRIETIRSNPNQNANSWITLMSKDSFALKETVEEIKKLLSEQ
jgi:uncharacterized protein YlzI (FlbEa/FlbD family)|tara:strand:- start:144 stop:326 length:183 start_codon:yes stop_codon:yes gene_type:complete